MASVKSPELGSVGALGWQVHPRVGSSFQHGDDRRSSQQDGGSDGKLNRVGSSKERAEDDHAEDEGDAGSEDSMDWALQWKQQREYEKQHKQLREEHNQLLLDANKILDSSSDEEDEGGDANIRGRINGGPRSIEEQSGAVSPRRSSPRRVGKESNTSSLSFVERAHAFMNARDTKVNELAKELEGKVMESHTFQPKVNQNATSPVGAPRDFAKRTRLHLEQKNEKIASRAFQLQLEEAARMRSKPRLVSKQQQLDKTPVVDRLYAAGERSKQKRDALRKSLEEHDEVSGQRLFHPKLAPTRASPVAHSPRVNKLYGGEKNDDDQPRLYREAQARQKRAVDRRRDADQALAKAVADATRANTKSTQYIRERTERDLETAYKLFLGRFDDSVTLPGEDGLMYPHVYASTLHLIRSKHLRVQSGSENDDRNSAFVAQVVWQQLKGQRSSTSSRAVVLDEDSWSRFIEKMNFGLGSTGASRQRGEHGDLNNVITMSTLGIPPPDPAPAPAPGDIVSVISKDTRRDAPASPRAPPPPPENISPNWRFPEFLMEMEAVVENTGGVSTAPVVPRTLSPEVRRTVCCAFLAACVRWVDQIRAQSTGTLGAVAAAKKRETQSCTFSPAINAKSRVMEAQARRQQQQRQRQVVDGQQKLSEASTIPTPSGLDTEIVPSSAASIQRPGTKQTRADMMLQKHHAAQARLELAKAKKEEDEQRSLTFKPVVKGFSYRPTGTQSAGPQSHSRSDNAMMSKVNRSGPAHLRLYKQANSNAAFLQAERRKLKEKEVEGCTFQPDRVTKKSYKNKPPPPPANVPKKTTAAISEHVERIKAAKERKDKQKLIDSQANVYSEETYQKSQMNKEVVPFQLATDRRQGDREKNTPALYMDVNMGKGKTGRIGIVPGDRAIELAEKFAAVHSLRQSEAVQKLAGLIQETAERKGLRLVR